MFRSVMGAQETETNRFIPHTYLPLEVLAAVKVSFLNLTGLQGPSAGHKISKTSSPKTLYLWRLVQKIYLPVPELRLGRPSCKKEPVVLKVLKQGRAEVTCMAAASKKKKDQPAAKVSGHTAEG